MVTRGTRAWIAAALLAAAVGLAVRPLGSGPFRLEIGRAEPDPQAVAGSFYFRAARARSGIELPLFSA